MTTWLSENGQFNYAHLQIGWVFFPRDIDLNNLNDGFRDTLLDVVQVENMVRKWVAILCSWDILGYTPSTA